PNYDPRLREFEVNELAVSKLEECLHSGVSAENAFHRGGDKTWLLFEIWRCSRDGREIPKWAIDALDQAYRAALAGDLSSWDEVFGKPFPKGTQPRRRRALIRKWEVWAMVHDLAEEGNAIDDSLFERVGKKLAIGGRTKVKELYAACEKQIENGEFGPT